MADTDNEPPLVDTHFHIYTTDLPLAPMPGTGRRKMPASIG